MVRDGLPYYKGKRYEVKGNTKAKINRDPNGKHPESVTEVR